MRPIPVLAVLALLALPPGLRPEYERALAAARAALEAQRPAEALEQAAVAARLAPRSAEALETSAEALIALGRHAEAVAPLRGPRRAIRPGRGMPRRTRRRR